MCQVTGLALPPACGRRRCATTVSLGASPAARSNTCHFVSITRQHDITTRQHDSTQQHVSITSLHVSTHGHLCYPMHVPITLRLCARTDHTGLSLLPNARTYHTKTIPYDTITLTLCPIRTYHTQPSLLPNARA